MSSHKDKEIPKDKLIPDCTINDDVEDNATDNGSPNLNEMSDLLNNLNGIDLNQISSLLNNVDLGQLSSFGGLINGMKGNNQKDALNFNNNKGVNVLNAIKPLLPAERSKLIDMVLQVYTISRILKK